MASANRHVTPILPFLRLVWSKCSHPRTSSRYTMPLLVHTGVSRSREGIYRITPDYVEVNVSNRAVYSEANKALIRLLSDVLKVPRSDLEILKGEKSKWKLVQVRVGTKGSDEDKMKYIGNMLGRRAQVMGCQKATEEVGKGEEKEQEREEVLLFVGYKKGTNYLRAFRE